MKLIKNKTCLYHQSSLRVGISGRYPASFHQKNGPLKRALADQMWVEEEDYYRDVVMEMSPHAPVDLFQVWISHLSLLRGNLERGFY